jgi:hypothetical protein
MARRGWADDRAGRPDSTRPTHTYAPVAAAARDGPPRDPLDPSASGASEFTYREIDRELDASRDSASASAPSFLPDGSEW